MSLSLKQKASVCGSMGGVILHYFKKVTFIMERKVNNIISFNLSKKVRVLSSYDN